MFLFAFVSPLWAQVDLSQMPWSEIAQLVLSAVTAKNWWLVAGLVLWLLVAGLKAYGAKVPFIGPKLAAFLELKWTIPLFTVLLALAGGLVNLVMAGQLPTWSWLVTVLLSAGTAIFTQEVKSAALKAGQTASGKIQTAEDADKFFKG